MSLPFLGTTAAVVSQVFSG